MPDDAAFQLSNPPTLAAPAGYSHLATVGAGRLVFISGQVALDNKGNIVGKDDFRAQVKQVFENLRAALEAVGASFRDVIKLNSYVVDTAALPHYRAVRDEYVNIANPPASTAVQVVRLFRPEFLVEVEAIAVLEIR
ncbi:MAG: RidA family protein [Steroidobacteraceae bacterium]